MNEQWTKKNHPNNDLIRMTLCVCFGIQLCIQCYVDVDMPLRTAVAVDFHINEITAEKSSQQTDPPNRSHK